LAVIEEKPSPSKGLGLQLAPPDYQSFLRPWSEERQLNTFYQGDLLNGIGNKIVKR
jgi:hypothetical protein